MTFFHFHSLCLFSIIINNIIIPMRKDRGVVIRWKQGLPSAGCGGKNSLSNAPPFPVITLPNASPSQEHWEGRSIGKGGALGRESTG